jgi:tol-pal system protein YbgF
MKIYVFFLFLIINSNVIANQNSEEMNIDKDDEKSIIEEENDIELVKNEIIKLKAIINKIENEIVGLSEQVKNIENSLVTSNKNLAIQAPQKTLTQKNYEEEKKDYDLALTSLKDGDYNLAGQNFSKFINDYPDSSLLSNVYFWYGELYYKQKDFKNAGIYFLNGYRKFPRGIKAADSLLKLSLSLGQLDKGPEACKIIDKLQKEFKERSLSSMQKEKEILEKYNCPKL